MTHRESAEQALITLLTVVVFGLGWVAFELETGAESQGSRYAAPESSACPAPPKTPPTTFRSPRSELARAAGMDEGRM